MDALGTFAGFSALGRGSRGPEYRVQPALRRGSWNAERRPRAGAAIR